MKKRLPAKKRAENLATADAAVKKIQKIIAVAGFFAALIAGIIKGLSDNTEYR